MIGLIRHSGRWMALGALVLLGIGTGAFLVARNPVAAEPSMPQVPVSLRRQQQDPLIPQRSKGKETAPITIYEMSDFQCPFCRRQALDVLPLLEKEYIETGKLRWVFINLPLTAIHANAVAAHELAMCSAKVDKFWQVHDLLFTYQKKWGSLKDPGAFMISLADSAGISRDAIAPCLESGEMRGLIQSEAEGAGKNGVGSTPTVYVEGAGLIQGAQPIEVYRAILDSLWKDKTAGEKSR